METIDILFLDGFGIEDSRLSYLGYLPPLAAELNHHSYSFKIFNINTCEKSSFECILKELEKHCFFTIGMTTSADNISDVYKMCGVLKKHYPDIPIILGGPQVTFSDAETLQESHCDIVIRNRGEKSLIKILDVIIKKEGELSNIKGISFKEQGNITQNLGELAFDINTAPLPFFQIYNDPKYWIIPEKCSISDFKGLLKRIVSENRYFLTGTGCPYKCSFCVEGSVHSKYIYKNIDNVKRDLKHFLSVAKAKYFAFADDTFTSSPKRVRDLCEMIKEIHDEGYYFQWFAEGRVDILSKNPELIKIMIDAGMTRLQLGLESGRQETLDAYNKKITLNQIEIVIKETAKYEILSVVGNIIMASPNESLEEYLLTLDYFEKLILLSDLKLDVDSVYLTPFKGTPIRNNPEKFGIEILVDNFEFNSSAMSNVLCKSNRMSLSDTYMIGGYSKTRILSFYQKNLYKASRNKIMSLHRTGQVAGSVLFNAVTHSLPSFKRLFDLADSIATITPQYHNEYINCYPLRLWDLEFLNDSYYFVALSEEEFYLKNENKELWDFASGKNSILDIFTEINILHPKIELEYIVNYYKKLEEVLALVFRKY